MTCDEYQEQVSQYIDGELNDKDSGILFKHLSMCGECRSFLRSTLELRSVIHNEMLMEQEVAKTNNKNRLGFRSAPLRTFRISKMLAGAALVFVILATIVVTRSITTSNLAEGNERVIYITSLPTVEVQGHPVSENDVKQ